MASKKGKPKAPGKKLRDAKIIGMTMEGFTAGEIGAELGMTRQNVSVILNSDETKRIIDHAETAIIRQIESATDVLRDAMEGRGLEMANAIKAALAVLKTHGLIREKSEVSHSFPEPLIIECENGKQIIVGSTADLKKEEGET